MSIRGKKDGFMNILKQISLIWQSWVPRSSYNISGKDFLIVLWVTDQSTFSKQLPLPNITQERISFRHFKHLSQHICLFLVDSTVQDISFGANLLLAKFPRPSRGANSLTAKAYIYVCVSLLALLGKSPLANCEVPWFGGSLLWLYSRCHLPLLVKNWSIFLASWTSSSTC